MTFVKKAMNVLKILRAITYKTKIMLTNKIIFAWIRLKKELIRKVKILISEEREAINSPTTMEQIRK